MTQPATETHDPRHDPDDRHDRDDRNDRDEQETVTAQGGGAEGHGAEGIPSGESGVHGQQAEREATVTAEPAGSEVPPLDEDAMAGEGAERVAAGQDDARVSAPTPADSAANLPSHVALDDLDDGDAARPVGDPPTDATNVTDADGADEAGSAGSADGDESDGTPRRSNRVRLLEREGEVAADFLERLLDIADLDGDIEVDIDGDRAAVAIVDSEDGRVPRRLVGSDGKVLEALQELTRLAVQAETGERSRLMLDVAGHRAQRRVQLVEIARTAIAEVRTTGQRTALEDMSAFERKIVHDEVAAAGLDSESEGVEPHRHIVVFPA